MKKNTDLPPEFIQAFRNTIFGTLNNLVLTRKLGNGASATLN